MNMSRIVLRFSWNKLINKFETNVMNKLINWEHSISSVFVFEFHENKFLYLL